jgi:1-acyl-sn-glycerol-3-phosphate acyltransferase
MTGQYFGMLQKLALLIIRISGWELVGEIPRLQKAVFIAAPHTSNWDGFWLLVAKCALKLDVRFLAKHTLFWWPLGPLLRAFGALPIDRALASTAVDLLVKKFRDEEKLFLALAPEGTRRWRPHWKSGFYRIANAANVPIVLAFIDYSRKRMGIGTVLSEFKGVQQDLNFIREFYAPFAGRRPENASPVEFPPE